MKLTKNHKILIGVGLAGAGIYWYMNRKPKTPKASETAKDTVTTATTESVETGTKEPQTREEKENYVIENVTATTKEESTGFDGDRFEFDPTVGYEMPRGVVQQNGESDSFDISMPDSDDFEVMSGADGDYDYDSFDDDEGYDVFYGVDGEETANPVAEAKAVVQQLDDAELTKAVQVVKTVKADPSAEQGSILASLGTDGQMADKIARLLNDIKVLKKQPDWKAIYEQEKASSKQGRGTLRRKWKGMGKGLGRLALSNQSCDELFNKWATNKRLTAGGKEKFIAKCEKRKNKLVERGVGRKKFGRGVRANKKPANWVGRPMQSQAMNSVVSRRNKKPANWVGRPSSPMSIRDERKQVVRAVASRTGIKKGDIKNCLRHPHTCQKNVGGVVKQKLRTLVSSRPRLRNLFTRRRSR